MPNYRRYYEPGRAVFVTIVTNRRVPWLGFDRNKDVVISSMIWVKSKYPFRHIAHVILPDHLHWMFEPLSSPNFSRVVGSLKRDVTWRMRERPAPRIGIGQSMWQRRFYDHVIRDDDDFARHLDYVHFNPVKHGVVSRPSAYRYSTFAEWSKRGVYTAGWGTDEPNHIAGLELE